MVAAFCLLLIAASSAAAFELPTDVEAAFEAGRLDDARVAMQLHLNRVIAARAAPDDQARACNALGVIQVASGNSTQALPLFERAMEIAKQNATLTRTDLAEYTNNYGNTLLRLDRVAEGMKQVRAAEDLWAQHPPDYRRLRSWVGPTDLEPTFLGKLAGAQVLSEAARAATKETVPFVVIAAFQFAEQNLPAGDSRLVPYLENAALAYEKLSEYSKAEDLLRRAVAILERTGGSSRSELSSAKLRLGLLLQRRERLDDALALMTAARELTSSEKGEPSIEHLEALEALGDLLVSLGKPDEAYRIYDEGGNLSVSIADSTLSAVAYSHFRARQARIALGQRNFTKARALLEDAVRVQSPKSASPPAYRDSFVELTSVDLLSATNAPEQAAGQLRELFINKLKPRGGGLLGAYGDLDQILKSSLRIVSMHPASEAARAWALTAVLSMKGKRLDADVLQSAQLRLSANPVQRRTFERWRILQAEAVAALISPSTKDAVANGKLGRAMIAAREERYAMEVELYQAPGSGSMVQPTDLQRALPQHGCLIEFATLSAGDALLRYSVEVARADKYFAFILCKDIDAQAVQFDRPTVDKAIKDLREAFAPENAGRRQQQRERLNQMYRVLYAPIERTLPKETRVLVISPDAQINLIPFAALLDDGGTYLVQNVSVSYVTSGRDLLRHGFGVAGSAPLLFGDPAYGRANRPDALPSVALRSDVWTELPDSRREVEAISRVLSKDAEVLLDKKATRQALLSAKRPEILHVAAHGYYAQDFCVNCETDLNPSWLRTSVADIPAAIELNDLRASPLMKNGIVLSNGAGANPQPARVTGLEVANLDLTGTRLAVFSACETGLGVIEEAEGLFGLRRALVIAGTESQVLSLWKVQSPATTELMTEFYSQLACGVPRAEALRQAQLRLLGEPDKGYTGPFSWAPFTLSGDSGVLQSVPPDSSLETCLDVKRAQASSAATPARSDEVPRQNTAAATPGETLSTPSTPSQRPVVVPGKPTWVSHLNARPVYVTSNSRYIFFSSGNAVTALLRASGATAWSYTPPKALKGEPFLSRDELYVPIEEEIKVLDAATGGERRSIRLDALNCCWLAGDTLYASIWQGTVKAVERASGKEIWSWRRPLPTSQDLLADVPLTAVRTDALVVAGFGDGAVFGLDAASGALRWRYDGDGPAHDIARSGDELVLVLLGEDLHALNPKSGEGLWKVRLQEPHAFGPGRAQIWDAGDVVYVYLLNLRSYIYAVSKREHKVMWRMADVTDAVLTNQEIFAVADDGLITVDLQLGTRRVLQPGLARANLYPVLGGLVAYSEDKRVSFVNINKE
jgi:CHAT domain-containing protein/outer membrane protein assembly factor BamB